MARIRAVATIDTRPRAAHPCDAVRFRQRKLTLLRGTKFINHLNHYSNEKVFISCHSSEWHSLHAGW